MNMQKLMAEAQKLQKSMQKKLTEYDSQEFEFNYKNYVQIKIKGNLEIISLKISDEMVDPDDKETLEDVVQEAINQAIKETTKGKTDLTAKIAGPSMPGMF